MNVKRAWEWDPAHRNGATSMEMGSNTEMEPMHRYGTNEMGMGPNTKDWIQAVGSESST